MKFLETIKSKLFAYRENQAVKEAISSLFKVRYIEEGDTQQLFIESLEGRLEFIGDIYTEWTFQKLELEETQLKIWFRKKRWGEKRYMLLQKRRDESWNIEGEFYFSLWKGMYFPSPFGYRSIYMYFNDRSPQKSAVTISFKEVM